ncbi:response regulator transcription factor [Gordonia sp. NPDC003424]
MDDHASCDIKALLNLAVTLGSADAAHELLAAASGSVTSLNAIRGALLARLRAGFAPNEMRRAAELVAEIESLKRRAEARHLMTTHRHVAGLRALLADLTQASRAERPYSVTRRLCSDMGFRKSVYSPATRCGWSPTTIALHPDLDDAFGPLRQAIEELSLPPGAAPREEDVMRTGRSIAVDPADIYRDTYRPLVELSRPRGYLAVPVTAFGRVTGLLHADLHDVDLTTADLEALENAAAVYSLTEERLSLKTTIATRSAEAQDALNALQRAVDEIETTQLSLKDILSEQASIEIEAPPRSHHELRTALTTREHEVFDMIAQGQSATGIAHALYLSESTVKSHTKRIYRKLGISSRAEAAALQRSLPHDELVG